MSVSPLPTTDPIEELLGAMREYQRAERLSDVEMSTLLGVPRSTWTAAKNGVFKPGIPFVHKIARCAVFRDLAQAILIPRDDELVRP